VFEEVNVEGGLLSPLPKIPPFAPNPPVEAPVPVVEEVNPVAGELLPRALTDPAPKALCCGFPNGLEVPPKALVYAAGAPVPKGLAVFVFVLAEEGLAVGWPKVKVGFGLLGSFCWLRNAGACQPETEIGEYT
jgi:hypothetical protein